MITDEQLKSIANDEHQPDEINLWNLMIEMAKEMIRLRKESDELNRMLHISFDKISKLRAINKLS
jgi:hypothetical protein